MPKQQGSKKKKPKVEEINGVLWLLDNNGNPIKKVKKKSKPDGNNADQAVQSTGTNGDGDDNRKKKQRPNVQEIDGVLYQVDENGDPTKRLRRKGTPRQEPLSAKEQAEARRRARSQGPVAGRRRPRERIDAGDQRLRSRSVGRDQQKPGEYTDSKGRKVIIDEDGNKTVFDKNGRRLRPKKKPNPTDGSINIRSPSVSNSNKVANKSFPSIGDKHDLMKSSIYNSGRFDDIWGDKQTSNSQMPPSPTNRMNHRSISSEISLNHSQLSSANPAKINGNSGIGNTGSNNNKSNNNSDNNNDANEAQIAELNKQVNEYGDENRDLKTKLMTAEDKVRNLTLQNQKEKSKNVKATTDMLQLKADFQQASDEKRNLDLQIKNLEARLREREEELEKVERTPANRRISVAGPNAGGSDHLVTQISDLMAENDALLDKLELAKASSGHDLKKKEEQILFLNEELKKLRDENDILFRGEAEKDPLMGKLLTQKKELEDKLKQEKEKSSIRIDSMQETIDGLEKSNAILKKDLEKATLEIHDDDDDDIRRAKEMAQAVAKHGTGNARQVKRASSMQAERPQRNSSFGWGLSRANVS